MFLAMLFIGCDDGCDSIVAIEWNANEERCADLADRADCCPSGYELLGTDRDGGTLCYADGACDTVVAISGDVEGQSCELDDGDVCCPNGYEVVGYAVNGSLVCLGG